MTTYKGIAVVTQTLRLIAREALRAAVPEAKVSLRRPEETSAAAADEPRLNIYLIDVGFEASMRNNDLPTRSSNGSLIAVPQVPVTLRYLFTYFGAELQAHLMLGAIEIALHTTPELSQVAIQQAVAAHSTPPDLHGSGLEQQVPPVRVIPASLPLETMSRFWSGFFQVPYTLSSVHDVAPVLLSAELSPTGALPVGQVVPKAGDMPPRLDPLSPVNYRAAAAITVSGRDIAEGQAVSIDGTWSPITIGRDGQTLEFALPENVAAGTRRVQLGATPQGATGPAPIPGAGSQDLVIRPTIERLTYRGSRVRVKISPPVASGQIVNLTLNGLQHPAGSPAPSRVRTITVSAPASELDFQVALPGEPALPPGSYLATVSVDGAASQLEQRNGVFSKPKVRIR